MVQKNKALKIKEHVDLEHMFRHACAFVDCAEACELEPNHIKFRTKSHLTADMVNSALACEIFLKVLLVLNGTDLKTLKRIHELNKLWSRYKESDKKSALYIEIYINNQWFGAKNKPFNNLLEESSRAFVDWRYIYEFVRIDIHYNFLRGFRSILREICCHKVYGNSWQDYIELMKRGSK